MANTSIDILIDRREELTRNLSAVMHHFNEALHEDIRMHSQSKLNQREKHLDELERLIGDVEEQIEKVKDEIVRNIHKQLSASEITEQQADDHGNCAICLEDYKEDNIIEKTPCNHIFHSDCLIYWIDKDNVTCPLCRANLGK